MRMCHRISIDGAAHGFVRFPEIHGMFGAGEGDAARFEDEGGDGTVVTHDFGIDVASRAGSVAHHVTEDAEHQGTSDAEIGIDESGSCADESHGFVRAEEHGEDGEKTIHDIGEMDDRGASGDVHGPFFKQFDGQPFALDGHLGTPEFCCHGVWGQVHGIHRACLLEGCIDIVYGHGHGIQRSQNGHGGHPEMGRCNVKGRRVHGIDVPKQHGECHGGLGKVCLGLSLRSIPKINV